MVIENEPLPQFSIPCALSSKILLQQERTEVFNVQRIAPQVMMATTNGTFGSQTFGISSGTSGCTNDGTIMAEHKVNVFAAANYESLSQEMARGGGEHLASLAELMGVPEETRPEFFALAQTQYATLVASGNTTPTAMIETLQSGIKTHPNLVKVSSN
jgi:Protein of unknown function (DUF3015)